MDKFGELFETCVKPNITFDFTQIPVRKNDHHVYNVDFKRFLVTLTFDNKEIVVNYYSTAVPNLINVLEHIVLVSKCVYETNFVQFCQNYDYNEDSIKVRNKFKDCKKLSKKLETLLGKELFVDFMKSL